MSASQTKAALDKQWKQAPAKIGTVEVFHLTREKMDELELLDQPGERGLNALVDSAREVIKRGDASMVEFKVVISS